MHGHLTILELSLACGCMYSWSLSVSFISEVSKIPVMFRWKNRQTYFYICVLLN